ncbi:undecaprenyl-diphosphatase [Bacillus sp. JJ722]|uniref:undecaprenyl-diphosphatase n=1 Tax=Bacillus sp. JJ722 TaxID=3122973 RepID=UPI002FFD8207
MNSEFNVSLFRSINDLGKEYSFLNPISILFAEYTVYFLVVSVILFWFTRSSRNRIMIISAGISFILAEIIGKTAGLLYSNQQPFAELSNVNKLIEKTVGNSFPSDHTILFFTFCFSFFFFKTRFKYIWIILAFSVGLSRILVGVHYPYDVMTGAIIGIATSFICFRVIPNRKIFNQLLEYYEKVERKIIPLKENEKDF